MKLKTLILALALSVCAFGQTQRATNFIASNNITAGALTSGRVVFAGAGGILSGAAAFTFNSGTGALSATNFIGTFAGNTFTTGTGTLTIAAGKTFTSSNTLTLTGTDGSTLGIGTGGTLGTSAFTAATAYTSSAIVPSTAPSAGQLLVGNAGGTAYAPVSLSSDATLASTGALTLANSGVAAATYGSASAVAQVTLDAKGRATAASDVAISITPTQAGLSNVTNDVQTKAAIVPNTVPSAGQIAVGNAGGTAYAPVSMSGDATLASTGAITLATVNGNVGTFGSATVASVVTVNAKGLVTAASNATITPSAASITAGTLTANITLGENIGLIYNPALGTADRYSGIVRAGTAGATLAFGDTVYLAAADSRWELTDSDASATSGPVLIGICVLAAAADGDPTTILMQGFIRADTAFPAMTISAPMYLSGTAGDITGTAPTAGGTFVRAVGHAVTADELYWNPTATYFEN